MTIANLPEMIMLIETCLSYFFEYTSLVVGIEQLPTDIILVLKAGLSNG
jgi:hypothetical protein